MNRRSNTEKRSVRTLMSLAPMKQDGQDEQDEQDGGAIAGVCLLQYEKI